MTLDSTDHGSGECDVTLAGYELPDGETEATRENLDDQELVDHRTETLEEGETTTLTIDLDA